MRFPDTYENIIKESNTSDGGYVQMEWNATEGEVLPAGTECPIDSDYLLFSPYWPSQQSVFSYRYAPKFLHRMAQLDYLPFYFKTKAIAGTDENGNIKTEDLALSTYPYTGNIQTIADALAHCLSDHGDLGSWSIDCGNLSESATASINFDGATVKSAASAIAEAFGTDYQFVWAKKTIRFGSAGETTFTPEYGTDALVSATDGGIQYNTFRILGGTRNMSKKTLQGKNVQVTQRLTLDGDSVMGGGSPKIMKDLVFDDIYPKMELWIYDVHERRCWLTDENGKKITDSQQRDPETGGVITTYKQYSKWYFKLARWNGMELEPYKFDKSLIIESMPLSMVFQPNYEDGALAQPLVGREFELTYFDASNPEREKGADDVDDGYQPVSGEFRIIFKVDGGVILPSTSDEKLCPYGGGMDKRNNKVTLTNVTMDDVYKEAARVELRKAGEAAVEAYKADKSSFTYQTYMGLGNVPEVGGRVTSVRQNLITGEVQYTVGNSQNDKGLIDRLSDKIDTISAGSGNATINDESSGRGGGVSESSIPLLSQLMGSGNVTKDTLTILKELILGTNGHGVKIDSNGDAMMTIGSLTVMGTTHLNEIDINHIKHTGGMMVVTKANIIVDHVEHLPGGLDKLYFRRRDANGQAIFNQFEEGDLALMMVFNEALDGSVNRYYWREVSGTDDGTEEFGYIILLPSSASHSEPKEGDVVVQLGHTTKPERQGATVFGGSGKNGGFFAVYEGFKTWQETAPQLDDYERALTYISPKRNKLSGDMVSVAGHDLTEQLDALRGSLNSVREQSDKQLVIWYGDEAEPLPNSGDTKHWNEPAKEWHDSDTKTGTIEQQTMHQEDVYYLRRNNTTRKGGRAWQWIYDCALKQHLWVEITDADTLASLEAADHAVDTAEEAKRKVESLADDGVISAGTEKSQLLIQWQDTVAEYVKYIDQAKDYHLDEAKNGGSGQNIIYTPYNDYRRKYEALAVMLNGGSSENIESIKSGSMLPKWLTSINIDTKIHVPASDYRMVWENYFMSRATLLREIESKAKDATDTAQGAADAAQSTADEKKRIFSTRPNELPPVPYDAGDMWLNAVWCESVDGHAVYRWNGDALYCLRARGESEEASIDDWGDATSGITSRIANLGKMIVAEVTDRKNSTSGGLYIDSTSGSLYARNYDNDGDIEIESIIQTLVTTDGNGELTGKLLLKSDNVSIEGSLLKVISDGVNINAGQVDFTTGIFAIDAAHINFKSQTIDLTASTVKLNAGQLTYAGQTMDLTAATVALNAGQLTYAGQTIDLTAATVALNAGQLTYAGQTMDLTAATVTLNAGQLTYAGQTIDLTAATVKLNANQVNFNVDDYTINAAKLVFEGRTEINEKFIVHEDGHLQLDWLEATNVKVNGVVASPFVIEDSTYTYPWEGNEVYYAAQFHDNLLYNSNVHCLYWTPECSGRLLTLCHDENVNGTTAFYAPEGMYFYEAGQKRTTIYVSRQCVILKGYGTAEKFFGYIVVRRIDLAPTRQYGREVKCLAFGTVHYSNGSVWLSVNNTFDGKRMSCSRINTGIYQVNIPKEWNIQSDRLFVMAVALSDISGGANPLYAGVRGYNVESGVVTGFSVQCGDDSTRNDGDVQFMLYNSADWENI